MSKKPYPSESLQAHIDWYVEQGCRVAQQTDRNALLVRRKRFFSRVTALLSNFVETLAWLLSQSSSPRDDLEKDETVYLHIEDGMVRASKR